MGLLELVSFSKDLMEENEGRREEEEEGKTASFWSRVYSLSHRQEGQKPVNCSCGCVSQLKEDRGGCAGGCCGPRGCGSAVGFISAAGRM